MKQAVTFRLPPELLKEAKRIAIRAGTTTTAVVEEGLRMAIDAKGEGADVLAAELSSHDDRISRLERIIERMSEGM